MACYTQLNHTQITHFLTTYQLGDLIDYQGISAGVENTNYFVTTKSAGEASNDHVLTLFEDLPYDELPYFIALAEHLVSRGVSVPAPLRDRTAKALQSLAEKPALLLPRFQGAPLKRPQINAYICAQVGKELGMLHKAGRDFSHHRQAHRGYEWWTQLAPKIGSLLRDNEAELLQQSIDAYQTFLEAGPALPIGVIHGDLFHDNVLFDGHRLSAIIDLYNACTDYLLFDVAVAVNDWCITDDGHIKQDLFEAFIAAYRVVRPFTEVEYEHWDLMLQTAAMRFWLSRLEAKYQLLKQDKVSDDTGLKDPQAFKNILMLRKQYSHSLQGV